MAKFEYDRSVRLIVLTSFLFTIVLFLVLLERLLRRIEDDVDQIKIEHSKNEYDTTEDVLAMEKIHGNRAEYFDKKLNYSSSNINFIDGLRVTTDQVDGLQSKCYVFGGSTILNIETCDSETVTSNLQRLINSNDLKFNVINMGGSGYKVEKNFADLSTIRLNKRDIVVVYFGFNDRFKGYKQKAIFPFSWIPAYVKVVGFLRLRMNLLIANWLWLETIGPSEDLIEEVDARTKDVVETLVKMKKFSETQNAKFVALLQPNLFTYRYYSLSSNWEKYRAGLDLQYRSYKFFLKQYSWFCDLTAGLDVVRPNPYTDSIHVDERGNKEIAMRVYREIKPYLGEINHEVSSES